ncbi:MAG: DNA polymerase I [Bacillota bacterium]
MSKAESGLEKLVLIDGNSLAYRAYFSHMELRTSGGQPTGAVFGFLRMLYKVLDEEKPTHLAVAFDLPGPTFRDEWYEAYKAGRPEAPDDFKVQLPVLRQALAALRVPCVECERYEADDIIGTLSRRAAAAGMAVVVVTGDRDALQLVTDRVTVLLTRKGVTDVVRFTPEKVQEVYGVTPAQIVDLKGLMGDASDNIPGVPGVGEKTAVKLLQQFGSLEAVLEQVDKVSGAKLQERLRAHADDARLSKRLATIDCEAPVQVTLDDLRVQPPDYEAAGRLFRELEFRSLLPLVTPPGGGPEAPALGAAAGAGAGLGTGAAGAEGAGGPGGATAGAAGPSVAVGLALPDFTPVSDPEAARALVAELPPGVAVLAAMQPAPPGSPTGRLEPAGAALAVPGEGGVRALYWLPAAALPGLDGWWAQAADLAGFDLKPLMVWLRRRGVAPPEPAFDGAIAAYLLNPGRTVYRIEDLAREFGLPEVPEGETPGAVGGQAGALLALRPALEAALREAGLWSLFAEIEMPLVGILARMEATGIAVQREALEEMGRELEERILAVQQEIFQRVGYTFNLNSPKQLADVLFGKMGLPVIKRTKTGPSTDAEVLEELALQEPLVERILDYRTLVKLKGTYVDGLAPLIEADGRIHTTFNQTVAATGRLSSADPNLQNIPIRIEEGRRIRKVFIPGEPGWVLFAADYSQIELRVVAHFSGDEALLDAFRQDQDIHTRTAAEVFGVPMEEVTPEMRRRAKAVNFGLIYGQSDYGLARALGIGRGEAKEFIQRYFDRYPGVKAYMEQKVQEAREKGYVTTLLGRRRFLPEIHARTFAVRQNAERAAINTPIQGTAADLMKKAMVAICRRLDASGLRARLLLQVHDELVFEAPPEELPALYELVVGEMERALTLRVPLKVEAKVGRNWYEMEPYTP